MSVVRKCHALSALKRSSVVAPNQHKFIKTCRCDPLLGNHL
jgi:hypothetical protein